MDRTKSPKTATSAEAYRSYFAGARYPVLLVCRIGREEIDECHRLEDLVRWKVQCQKPLYEFESGMNRIPQQSERTLLVAMPSAPPKRPVQHLRFKCPRGPQVD
jgi:hypothetical protein